MKPRPEPNNPVDRHVGARIRMRRKRMDLTQSELAARLGVTFQQVQKYERGSNRVSASTLYEVARTLGVEPEYFFAGLVGETSGDLGASMLESALVFELASIPGGDDLLASFNRIADPLVRRGLLRLVRELASDEEGPGRELGPEQ